MLGFFYVVVLVFEIYFAFKVLFADKKSITNQSFSIFTILLFLWSFCIFVVKSTADFTWGSFAFFFGVLLIYSFGFLVSVFPKRNVSSLVQFFFLPALFLALSSFIPGAMFVNIDVSGQGIESQLGYMRPYLVLYALVYFFYISYILVKKYRNSIRVEKGKILILFSAFMIFSVITFSSNLFFPLFGFNNANVLEPLLSSVVVFIPAFSLMSGGLFNVKIVFFELFSVLLFVFIFAQITLADNTSELVLSLSVAFISFIIVFFLIKKLRKESDYQKQVAQLLDEKESLVYILDHQVRTPISQLKNSLYMINQDSFFELNSIKQKEVVEKLTKTTSQFFKMVNSFLLLLRLEKKGLDFTKSNIDIVSIFYETADDFLIDFKSKGFRLKINSDVQNFYISGVHELVRALFDNIFQNILFYANIGIVHIQLLNKDGQLCIVFGNEVKNYKEEINHLDKFVRGPNSESQNPHGSGLGLYLVAQIINWHAGTVVVERRDDIFEVKTFWNK